MPSHEEQKSQVDVGRASRPTATEDTPTQHYRGQPDPATVDPPTICPLFMLAYKVTERPANSGAAQCIRDRCAWWS